jgi:cytochrome bd ubiquinol oxidase subunit II
VVLTVSALLVTPVVLLYQGWTYHVFRRRLGEPEVDVPAQLAGL